MRYSSQHTKLEGQNRESDIIRVLLIEDDPADAQLVRELLADAGRVSIQLEHVERLSDGFGRLGQHEHKGPQRFDVILLDLSLPESEGLATFKRARSETHGIPIIALTSVDDEDLALGVVREGAQDCLLKEQLDTRLLERAMRFAIERHRRHTNQKEIEKAREEGERLYRDVIQAAGAVPYSKDCRGNRYEFMGEGIEALTGYEAGEFTPEIWESIVRERVLPEERNVYTPWGEYLIRTRSGEERWISDAGIDIRDESGRTVRLLGMLRDITRSKRMDAQLEKLVEVRMAEVSKAVQRLEMEVAERNRIADERRRLFDEMPLAGFVVGSSGETILANRSGAALAGAAGRDLHGAKPGRAVRCARAVANPDLCGQMEECPSCPLRGAIESVLAGGASVLEKEIVMHHDTPEGAEIRNHRMYVCPITFDGEPAALLVLDDITDRVHLTQDLAEARDAAQAASRAKSAFLANMSHELRTPLNAVIGFAKVLLRGAFGELNDEQERCVNDILESGEHLLSLVTDILDLSKIEAGKMELVLESCDLKPEVEKSLSFVQGEAAKRRITIATNVANDLPLVTVDCRAVRQVLINLLTNAVKFTPEGGRVDVNAFPYKDHVAVEVVDTGIGIPFGEQETIFGVFEQASRGRQNGEGTGLGLPLTRALLRAMGGLIAVESSPGEGSRFTFTLPIAKEKREEEAD